MWADLSGVEVSFTNASSPRITSDEGVGNNLDKIAIVLLLFQSLHVVHIHRNQAFPQGASRMNFPVTLPNILQITRHGVGSGNSGVREK